MLAAVGDGNRFCLLGARIVELSIQNFVWDLGTLKALSSSKTYLEAFL